MTTPRCNLAPRMAAILALAALSVMPALAQPQDAARTLGKGESVFIDGRTFSITHGMPKHDLTKEIEQLGARPLSAGALIFRNADGLYILDHAPPLIAAIPDGPARGGPPTDGPGNASVECGQGYALHDQGAYARPNPNQGCQRISRQDDMERPRPRGLPDAAIAPDDIEHMEGNPRIHIEYQPPKDPAQQNVYDAIKQRHMLEMVRKIFSPWNLGDIDLNIRTISCGVSNAWYQRVGKVPTVSICYEYLQEIWQSMPEETKEVKGDTIKDAVCGQLFFAVAHELGHAMFDIFDVPVFGRQEDAADEFATYIMLQFGGEQALQLIDGAAYGYHAYVKDLKEQPQVTLPLAAFSSDHGSPEQRYFNLICIAYGYDQRLFSLVMDKIPPSRAQKCKFEYEDLKFAMQTVFWPHLDHEKVARVLAMKWFVDANANTSAIKAN